jgi:hypothetical protein
LVNLATATDFVEDIAKPVKGRVQIPKDQLRTYLNVVKILLPDEQISLNSKRSIGLVAVLIPVLSREVHRL